MGDIMKSDIMEGAVGIADGYGNLGNAAEVVHMEELDTEGKKAHVKKIMARRR